jgi:hypothetical protein
MEPHHANSRSSARRLCPRASSSAPTGPVGPCGPAPTTTRGSERAGTALAFCIKGGTPTRNLPFVKHGSEGNFVTEWSLSFLDLRPLVHPHYGCFQIAWPDDKILPFSPFFHQGSQLISFRFIHVLVGFFDIHPLTFCFGSCFGFCFDSCRGFFLAASASTEDPVGDSTVST